MLSQQDSLGSEVTGQSLVPRTECWAGQQSLARALGLLGRNQWCFPWNNSDLVAKRASASKYQLEVRVQSWLENPGRLPKD